MCPAQQADGGSRARRTGGRKPGTAPSQPSGGQNLGGSCVCSSCPIFRAVANGVVISQTSLNTTTGATTGGILTLNSRRLVAFQCACNVMGQSDEGRSCALDAVRKGIIVHPGKSAGPASPKPSGNEQSTGKSSATGIGTGTTGSKDRRRRHGSGSIPGGKP